MAARKDVEKAVHVREFQRMIKQLLTSEDSNYLFYAMKEYNTYKSVAKLMLALNSCLDTPEKLDLLPYIRDLIPKHDRKRFDNLAPYNRMAHPLKVDRKTTGSLGKLVNGNAGGKGLQIPESENSRIISLQRTPGTSLGFSIRGGREHDLGIFISHVDSFSLAEQSGLEIGDQIVSVNGISFDRLSHSSAVLVLKSHDNLKIEVKHMGCVPGQKLGRNSFIWVDPSGNFLDQPDFEQLNRSDEEREEDPGNRLLSSPDKHKIVLHTSKKKSLGFSVRGGAEYSLGIYVSLVDKGSPAEESGLKVGDQIVDVNGHSFVSIFHQEAVYILRSYPTLIMTIKSIGKLPALAPSAKDTLNGYGENRGRSNTLPRKFGSKLSNNSSVTDSDTLAPAVQSSEEQVPLRQARVRRSQSERRSVPPGGFDSVDYGGDQRKVREQNSVTSRRKPMVVSPLATHESRAAPPHPHTSPTPITPKFFERGVGTQVMLASMTSQAKELLLDHARRKMKGREVVQLRECLEKYEEDNDVRELVDQLVPLLNTPDKMKLVTDIRSVLNPAHIVAFDEMVSPLELEALHESDSESVSSEEDTFLDYNTVLTKTENERWPRLAPLQARDKKPSLPELTPKHQSTLHKGSHVTSSDPNLSGINPRESYLSRGEDVGTQESEPRGTNRAESHLSLSKLTPIVVEVPKESPFLGMAVKGGVDTPYKNVYVRELRAGGAVHKEGFIQPGYEVVQVDDQKIRGKKYHEAVEAIAKAYNSDNPTIKIIVLPTPMP